MTGPFDVCVVGGGPAGAGLAAALARTGHRVAVVEQRVFPRDHVGESLSPGAWPLLDSLGIARSAVEAVAAPVRMSGVRWRTEREERVLVGARLTLDRGRFDALLLDHARASGATVRLGRARRPARTATGWRVPLDAGPVEARFLADASGRYALLGGRRIWTAPRTLALHARWGPVAPAEGPQTVVQALAEGWLWWARLPHDEVRAMVLLDQDRRRAELAEPGRLFRRLVFGSERGADLLAGLPPTAPVAVCDASSYRLAEVVTSDAIRVGEAAFAIDPLSSSGVQTALQTGLAAAATIRTVLSPDGDRAAALDYYAELVEAAALHHQQTARQLYAEHRAYADRPFWRRRSRGVDLAAPAAPRIGLDELLARPVRLRAPAELRATACRVGDRIERHRALCAPQLERPVGFLGGLPLGPLIETIEAAPSLGTALSGWERSLPPGRGALIASWLIGHGLLEPSEASGSR